MRRKRGSDPHVFPIVSVVIPVFNGERYLREMLDCVVRQTFRHIEVICVDDGSEDHSADIIRRYQERDARVRLIRRPHQNAGAARNAGLAEARGKYIVFWDADDRFDRRAIAVMYRKMEKTGADICVCGVREIFDGGRVFRANYLRMEFVPEKDPFNRSDMNGCLYDFASNVPWNKMFRRQFILENHLRFQEIRQANDTAFVMLALYCAEAITCTQERLADYRVDNPESLTGRSSQTVFCPYEAYLYTLRELKKREHFETVRESFRNKALMGMFRALNCQTSFEAYGQLYDFLKEEGLRMLEIEPCAREDLREGWMYRDLELMRASSAGEFLLHKANERRYERDRLKYTLRRVRERLALPLAVNEGLKQLKNSVAYRRKKA